MNIFITGASNGIGYALALEFCKRGNANVIALSRNKEKLEKLKKESGQFSNSKVMLYPADLEKLDHSHLLQFLSDNKINVIDKLINNAGLLLNKPFSDLTEDDWNKIYKVNVLSPAMLIKSFLPLMNRKERSHIVSISSMGGVQGTVKFPGLTAYSSSKSSLVTLTECLAEEFKEENISFNAVALGAVQTEMLQEAFPGYTAPVTPEEIAKWIVDFATTGQHYFNGKTLQVSRSTP